MCQYVSLEVVATPESSIAVVTDEILLDFQGTVIIVHFHCWNKMLTRITQLVLSELNIRIRCLHFYMFAHPHLDFNFAGGSCFFVLLLGLHILVCLHVLSISQS